MQFSHDGTWLAVYTREGVGVWDVASGQRILPIESQQSDDRYSGREGDASNDGNSRIPDRSARFGDSFATFDSSVFGGSGSKRDRQDILLRIDHGIDAFAFGPRRERIALAGTSSGVTVVELSTGRHIFTNDEQGAHILQFSPDGKRLIAFKFWEMTMWDLATGKEILHTPWHTYEFDSTGLWFNSNGKNLVGLSDDGVHVWDSEVGEKILSVTWDDTRTSALFSPNRQQVMADFPDGSREVWDLVTCTKKNVLRGMLGEASDMVFSPDGTQIAVGGEYFSDEYDENIRIWKLKAGPDVRQIKAHRKGVSDIAFGPDSRLIASASRDNTVKVWQVATGQKLHTLKANLEAVRVVAASPDGQLLASGNADGTVKLWSIYYNKSSNPPEIRIITGGTERTVAGPIGGVSSLAFSPTAKWLAAGGSDGTLMAWQWEPNKDLHEILHVDGHDSPVKALAFSGDSQRLVSIAMDGQVKVWSVPTRLELTTQGFHAGETRCAAVSPDGKRLAVYTTDRMLKIGDSYPRLRDAHTQRPC